jgi:hypothetical protein
VSFAFGMTDKPRRSAAIHFCKIYGIILAVDLLAYFLIFYVGKAIPPASPYTSYPGNYGLCLGWLFAHFPAALIFRNSSLPDHLMWLLVFQDAWMAAVILAWKRRKVS